MRKRHFLCKEITDMQWEVTDGKVSEKDGHTDMERTGMKTAIKKGIKIYSPKIKKQKKGKGSLQAICKNKRRVFLCFFQKTRGKKQQIPAVLTVEAALVIPLFLLGICTLLGIMDLYRVQALVKTSLHQSAQELAEKSRLKKVKGSEVLLIIQGLLQVLVQLEEYLIPADQICLDWNYIYLDPVSCYPSFCCLPAAEKKLEQGIRELLEELLPRLDHQEQTGVSVVYELYQYAIQDTFLVMGLQSVLERRLMEERKTTETELQACQEKKSREHQETSYFGDNRQAVLEDFFSSEEEEGENGRVSPVWVGMVLGIIGVLLYALAGYAVLEYVPQYLGTWAASGVMAILIVLIWQVVVRKRKKEERQIEEQFAIYQGTSEEAPRHSKTDIREWEEKDKEPEAEEITWEKRIPWGGDTYTQILSNGGEQGGLILKELHPVSGRQFRIEKATRLTIIGQLKEQADLVLPSTAVSRVHASIEQRAGNWYLKDMNSRNGTWVNEQELYGEEEQELINGDQIRFADLIYQVKI